MSVARAPHNRDTVIRLVFGVVDKTRSLPHTEGLRGLLSENLSKEVESAKHIK